MFGGGNNQSANGGSTAFGGAVGGNFLSGFKPGQASNAPVANNAHLMQMRKWLNIRYS